MRLTRAFRPRHSGLAPFTNYWGYFLQLARAERVAESLDGRPGQILRRDQDGGVVVKTVDGAVKIWSDFRSSQLQIGDFLETTSSVSGVTQVPYSDLETTEPLSDQEAALVVSFREMQTLLASL